MRFPTLRVVALVALWQALVPSASAWRLAADEDYPGTQALNISVGCASATAYPTTVDKKHATRPRFSTVVANRAAEFLSLHFATFNLPDDDYVVIRPTDDDTEALTYYGKNTTNDFFSQALKTASITLELYSPNGGHSTSTCFGFMIDSYRFLAAAATFEASAQEAVCGADDSDEAACCRAYPPQFKASDAVARLLIHKDGSSFFCTGWLMGCEGHVLTNHHCISNSLHAEHTEFEFMAESKSCDTKCNKPFGCTGVTRATTSELVIANPDLDYALVKVNGDLWKDYGFLQLRPGGAKLNERIYIPEHPAGWGKRIAVKTDDGLGTVVSLSQGGCLPDQVAYNLDTQGGSSGSPVLSWNDNAVVAIHHCGGCPNTAVNIDKIINDLQSKSLLPKCALWQPPDKPHDDGKGDDKHKGDGSDKGKQGDGSGKDKQ